jgi:hypothetical protein
MQHGIEAPLGLSREQLNTLSKDVRRFLPALAAYIAARKRLSASERFPLTREALQPAAHRYGFADDETGVHRCHRVIKEWRVTGVLVSAGAYRMERSISHTGSIRTAEGRFRQAASGGLRKLAFLYELPKRAAQKAARPFTAF